jgi:tRNA (guanine37-N1)-methyltransferase
MKFEIITLFPDYFSLSLKQSLIGKAREKRLFDIEIINLRDYATDKHHTVDDTPCGGGGGMVMMLEPLDRCLKGLGYKWKSEGSRSRSDRLILTSAAGQPFTQGLAVEYSLCERLTLICGHYLGVDERLLELYELDEVSIGDYVLTGGEPAAAVMVDAVARLIPKVLGNFESALGDSHMDKLIGAPCYTRPVDYAGLRVPEVLISGDHARIKKFRTDAARDKCRRNRPDLLARMEALEDDDN